MCHTQKGLNLDFRGNVVKWRLKSKKENDYFMKGNNCICFAWKKAYYKLWNGYSMHGWDVEYAFH